VLCVRISRLGIATSVNRTAKSRPSDAELLRYRGRTYVVINVLKASARQSFPRDSTRVHPQSGVCLRMDCLESGHPQQRKAGQPSERQSLSAFISASGVVAQPQQSIQRLPNNARLVTLESNFVDHGNAPNGCTSNDKSSRMSRSTERAGPGITLPSDHSGSRFGK
jgi:hypothetical protein